MGGKKRTPRGRKGRGREQPVICCACGCRVPRHKAVQMFKKTVYSPDSKYQEGETISAVMPRKIYYCPSCAKHRHIYQKKTRQNRRRKERENR